MDTDTAAVTHRITWWAILSNGKRIRRSGRMRGAWGFDVECTCGQKTNTGGATEHYLRDKVRFHKEFGIDL